MRIIMPTKREIDVLKALMKCSGQWIVKNEDGDVFLAKNPFWSLIPDPNKYERKVMNYSDLPEWFPEMKVDKFYRIDGFFEELL